jgi:hypothetical protein
MVQGSMLVTQRRRKQDAQNALRGFIDHYEVTVTDLQRVIGPLEISRPALDGLMLFKEVASHRRTIEKALRGLRKLVPHRKLTEAGLRFLVSQKRPAPDELTAMIDRAVAMVDEIESITH